MTQRQLFVLVSSGVHFAGWDKVNRRPLLAHHRHEASVRELRIAQCWKKFLEREGQGAWSLEAWCVSHVKEELALRMSPQEFEARRARVWNLRQRTA